MNKWTEEEVVLLLKSYNELPNEELLPLFPGRTYISLFKKARTLGLKRNKEISFINRSRVKRGKNSPSWKGGKTITKKGYVYVYVGGKKRKFEHVLIMEKKIDRLLSADECVHHINGNPRDNRIENLRLMTRGEHSVLHNKKRKWSNEQKAKQSQRMELNANRGKDHYLYKNINVKKILEDVQNGMTVKRACALQNCEKTSFYRRKKELGL